MSLTVYAPASMGNVGVGFDLLGAALAPIDGSLLGDRVTIAAAASGVSLMQTGAWAHKLPDNPQDNIVYQCAEFFLTALSKEFLEALGKADEGVALTLKEPARR